MPLTLTTLASLIPEDVPAEVTLVDEGIQDIDLDIEADLVGITVITGTAMRAYAIAKELRARGIAVVMGGPHVTLAADDVEPHADSIVVGYAEDEWPRLLRDFVAGEMRQRYVQAADLSLANRPRPSRHLLPRWRYVTSDVFEATRGCIHDCDFCVVPAAWGRTPLQKPVEDVVADIRAKGSQRAIFVDLNLIADKHYAAELFEALIPLKIQWYGLSTTLLCNDLPLLDLAARSGCRGLLMGLESISPGNLRPMGKAFNNPDSYANVVAELHKRQIALQGCFVFGLDEDTPDVFLRTARFAVEIGIDLPRFAVVTPFPGTALYHRLEYEGRIFTKNWELYDGQHVVFEPSKMTPEQLQWGVQAAWKYAYSWPNIARRVKTSPTPLPVALAGNHAYRRYGYRLDRFYNCDWVVSTPRNPMGLMR